MRLWFLLIAAAWALPGDELEEFEVCVEVCSDMCESVSLPLRLLLWDCALDCDYQCQRAVHLDRKHHGEELYQYHGKWPFIRVAGIQEVFSLVFSIGNLVPHVVGARQVYSAWHRTTSTAAARMYLHILLLAAVSIGAWTCSSVFHIRDLLVTERADYYMAGLTVLTGLYSVGVRHWEMYLDPVAHWRWSLACGAAYGAHIARLVIDWGYTYNMQANVACGVMQNAVWVMLCWKLYRREEFDEELRALKQEEAEENTETGLPTPPATSDTLAANVARVPFTPRVHGLITSRKAYALFPLVLNLLVVLGMLLEIFDFPPFFDLVDAHALWHLATIYPTYMMYPWIVWDVESNVARL